MPFAPFVANIAPSPSPSRSLLGIARASPRLPARTLSELHGGADPRPAATAFAEFSVLGAAEMNGTIFVTQPEANIIKQWTCMFLCFFQIGFQIDCNWGSGMFWAQPVFVWWQRLDPGTTLGRFHDLIHGMLLPNSKATLPAKPTSHLSGLHTWMDSPRSKKNAHKLLSAAGLTNTAKRSCGLIRWVNGSGEV